MPAPIKADLGSHLFALVVMDPAGKPTPEQVVVVFHLPAEAASFAGEHGFDDYKVVPLRFVTDLL